MVTFSFLGLLALSATAAVASARSFVVQGDEFLKDGVPFRIVSGAFHYFRTPAALWADRLHKMRLGGLNTVETYIAWNLHERVRGAFDFDGDLNFTRFIELAQTEGLLVLVRPSPFICAEWDYGGLPAWLDAVPGLAIRSDNAQYYDALEPFLVRTMQMIAPLQYARGGPVIGVQVENEYGNYGKNKAYLQRLHNIIRSAGVDSAFTFSSNGADTRKIVNGCNVGVDLCTVNFGLSRTAKDAFGALRAAMPTGPLFVSEYWIGWYDVWGSRHSTRDEAAVAKLLDEILSAGASVNFYMYVGGTNFGFTAGAVEGSGGYQPITTSYDYDTAITESGDVSSKWLTIRDVLAKYQTVPTDPAPLPSPKSEFHIEMTVWASLMDQATLSMISEPVRAQAPLSFTKLGLDFGYVMYETQLTSCNGSGVELTLSKLHDRALVFVDGEHQATLDRLHNKGDTFTATIACGETLNVLVENEGRIHTSSQDKGILGGISAAGKALDGPGGWTKGIVFINGNNIGRYWAMAPQTTLYVPASFLRSGSNEVVILETDASDSDMTANFVTAPVIH
eukprot:m51a1_g3558 putative beta-galactosidase (563) ;mRNA; r:1040445-1042432